MHHLKRLQWPSTACLALWLAASPAAVAQRDPHIGYVYPAGGQVGATFEAVIAGQYLIGATNVYVSGAGVQAVLVEHEPPLTPKQANELRERLQELRKKERDPAVIQEILQIRKRLAAFEKKRSTPAIAETVPVQITIAPDAVPGERELRLATATGLSNPLVFQVGQLPEFRKPEPKADDDAPFRRPQPGNAPSARPPEPPMAIPLPATVNGQILPGGVDRYRFQARQGQDLVVAVSARELIPYLADAVPGWFQAAVALYDGQGREVAYADHYQFHPDPVLVYPIRKEGEYVLEIKDSLYRGREDFVYRVAVGELPFVTSIYPLGGRVGTQPTVAIRGWNLPMARQKFDLRGEALGTYPFFVRSAGRFSNRVPFVVDTLPECLEREPNDSPTRAQAVKLPVVVNGRIDSPGDVDVFRFEGRAGDSVVAEVVARRLDSPLDSVLTLTDAYGRQLAFNDDHEDKGSGLETHHADSYLSATVPTNGTYYVHVGDAQHKGGWAYAYRLRISAPQPDFALRVVPSSINARVGGTVPVTVYALRRDGFTNAIAITLKDAPHGFKLSGGGVLANQDQARLTLTAPLTPTTEPIDLRIEGRATIQGTEIVHVAVSAEDMMQAFAYRHLVPSKELKVVVAGRGMPRASMGILSETPVRIASGGTARVRVRVPTTTVVGNVQLELSEPPDGITIQSVTPIPEGSEFVLQTDAARVKPGLKGNLIVKVFVQRTGPAEKEKPPVNRPRIAVGTLPSIPFEIVPP